MNNQLANTGGDFFELSKQIAHRQCKKRTSKAKVGPLFWTIFGIVVAVAALAVGIAALVITANTYNSRYDADAQAAGGIEYTFAANGKDTGSASFTSSVGTITYGYFQKSGNTPTQYTLSYKKSNNSNYSQLKNFIVYSNNNYTGSFHFANISNSTKFDVKCVKNSNKTVKSVFEFDWGV